MVLGFNHSPSSENKRCFQKNFFWQKKIIFEIKLTAWSILFKTIFKSNYGCSKKKVKNYWKNCLTMFPVFTRLFRIRTSIIFLIYRREVNFSITSVTFVKVNMNCYENFKIISSIFSFAELDSPWKILMSIFQILDHKNTAKKISRSNSVAERN